MTGLWRVREAVPAVILTSGNTRASVLRAPPLYSCTKLQQLHQLTVPLTSLGTRTLAEAVASAGGETGGMVTSPKGLTAHGPASQCDFLHGLGIRERAQALFENGS